MNLQSKLDKIRVILNTYCIRFLSYLGLWFSYYTLIPSLCYPVGSHQQSLAGDEYGDGNLGTRGMALFFHSHKVWVVINAIFGCYSLKGTLAYYFLFYHNFQNLRTVYNYLLTFCLGSITNIAEIMKWMYTYYFFSAIVSVRVWVWQSLICQIKKENASLMVFLIASQGKIIAN